MQSMKTLIAVAVLASCVVAGAAEPPASLTMVPAYVNYQARLVAPDGSPYSNATHDIELRLYEDAGGGSAVWGEKYSVKTQDGYLSVLLGSGGAPIAEKG